MIVQEARNKNRPAGLVREKVCCPLCGGHMHKADDARERNTPFHWFECDRRDCSGWLVQTTGWFK